MHMILVERQKYRTLRTLLEGDKFHLSHCECRDKRKMLRRPREDIAKLRTIFGKPPSSLQGRFTTENRFVAGNPRSFQTVGSSRPGTSRFFRGSTIHTKCV